MHYIVGSSIKLNRMFLNDDKCLTLEFRPKKSSNLVANTVHYEISKEPIKKCTDRGDLGLHVDSYLNFELHVQHIRLSCDRLIGLCFRFFALRDPSLYLMFWKVYVLPIILYCSLVFGLSTVSNINNIE